MTDGPRTFFICPCSLDKDFDAAGIRQHLKDAHGIEAAEGREFPRELAMHLKTGDGPRYVYEWTVGPGLKVQQYIGFTVQPSA